MSKRKTIVLSVVAVTVIAVCGLMSSVPSRKDSDDPPVSQLEPLETYHMVARGEKVGIISSAGREVIPTKYSDAIACYTPGPGSRVPFFLVSTATKADKYPYDEFMGMIVDTNGVELCEPKYEIYFDSVMRLAHYFVGTNAFLTRKLVDGEAHPVLLYTDGLEINGGPSYCPRMEDAGGFVIMTDDFGGKKYWNVNQRRFCSYREFKKKSRKGYHYQRPTYKLSLTSLKTKLKKDELSDKYALVDENGVALTEFMFDNASTYFNWNGFWNGVFPARCHGRWGVFKLDGTIVLPPEYDYLDTCSSGSDAIWPLD